ncbi:hypothetical protein Pfo_023937 [Paulownia fortunei]|nr:hypothetical protein Pfo_023937 [Paulownia fortunei]
MDFLSSLAKGDQPKPTSDQPNSSDHQEKPSNYDLFASAKVVADAAQAQFRNEPDKYDKAKVAGATADILNAASEYGKLDDTKGIGKYVDQAEDYLRQYNTSQSTTPAPVPAPVPAPASGENKTTTNDAPVPVPTGDSGEDKTAPVTVGDSGDDKAAPITTTTETTDAEKPSGGGAGDYIKMAEGFLNKPSGDGGEKTEASSKSEGGYGDLMKMAGGFLKK